MHQDHVFGLGFASRSDINYFVYLCLFMLGKYYLVTQISFNIVNQSEVAK